MHYVAVRMIEGIDGVMVPASKTTAARDQYVVCRAPVWEVYTQFVASWNIDHQPDSGRYAANSTRTDIAQIRAVEYLAAETKRLDPKRKGITERSLPDLFRRDPAGQLRYSTLDFDTADLLLAAMDKPDLMETDPRLQPQRRSARVCCRGSRSTVARGHLPIYGR